MFQNPKLMSKTADAQTRFVRSTSWSFAADQTAVALASDEVRALAREFTIVFSDATPSYPIALLGLDDKNLYIDAKGAWRAEKVPARFAVYPFGSVEKDGEVFMVRAADAPHFQDPAGDRLYDDHGEPTTLLMLVSKMASQLHRGLANAQVLTAQLDAAGLLMDGQLSGTLNDGSPQSVGGFRIINDSALLSLDATVRAALEASGAMDMLLAHRASLANFANLLPQVEGKKASKPKAAAASKAGKTAASADAKPAKAAPKTAKSAAAAKPAAAKAATATKPKAKAASASK
jgi:hypothetical protein